MEDFASLYLHLYSSSSHHIPTSAEPLMTKHYYLCRVLILMTTMLSDFYYSERERDRVGGERGQVLYMTKTSPVCRALHAKYATSAVFQQLTVDGLLDGTRCEYEVIVDFWSLGLEAGPSATARPRMIVLFPSSSTPSLGKPGETATPRFVQQKLLTFTKHAPDLAMLSVTAELAPVHSIIIQSCQVRFQRKNF